MRFKHALILLPCLALLLSLPACRRAAEHESDNGPRSRKNPPPTESQYLVETILGDLAEMAYFAGKKALPSATDFKIHAEEPTPAGGASPPTYLCEIKFGAAAPTLKPAITLNGPIWEPALYENAAKQLLAQAATVRAGSAQADGNGRLLEQLADLTAENLERANQEISARLQNDFTNPRWHEQAALVLGVFALREYAGDFYDVRHPLCRLTAHLALARALGGKGDHPEAQLAEVLLYTLMNNRQPALEKLARLPQTPALAVWTRALRARLTGDYRELNAAKSLTLLERIMLLDAYGRMLDTDIAWQQLEESGVKPQADFCRIINGLRHSVTVGIELDRLALRLEMAEAMQVYKMSRGGQLSEGNVVAALNELPQGCLAPSRRGPAEVRVIGWGEWAGFYQRHVCHTLAKSFNLLQRKRALPGKAKEFAAQSDRLFGGLRLYPFVRRMNSVTRAAYVKSIADALAVIQAQPELVPVGAWGYLQNPEKWTPLDPRAGETHLAAWNKDTVPPGTAYDLRPRLNARDANYEAGNRNFFERLYALAPYDTDVVAALLRFKRHNGESTDCEQLAAVYRPTLDYAPAGFVRMAAAARTNAPLYEKYMIQAAKLTPKYFFRLGDYFVARKEDDKAAGFYEQGVALWLDSVGVANGCSWLVQYYFHRGRITEAEHLANRAAAVPSFRGLETKSDLLFMEGKYEDSLACCRRIEERYQTPGAVVGWCLNYQAATGDSRYAKEVAQRLGALFPRGFEPVSLANFEGPPDEGMAYDKSNDLLRNAGLKPGDLVVAFNGIRVHDLGQFAYLWSTRKSDEMRLIIWDGEKFRESAAPAPTQPFKVPISWYRQGYR